MKIKLLGGMLILALLLALGGKVVASTSRIRTDGNAQALNIDGLAGSSRVRIAQGTTTAGPIIIDHTNADLSQIPDYWIEQAKEQLRVSYGHTSHGSQVIGGMALLRDDPAYAGLYDFNTNGALEQDTLSIADWTPEGDLGDPDRVTWEARTREYLDGLGSDRNVVIWSWCSQVSDATEADIDTYLSLMEGLENDYPDVTFVYMTGHLDGSGVDGNLNQRNDQIREFCRTHNKVLYDFSDIESFDPDGEYYLDRAANGYGDYDGDGDGSQESNWTHEWCAAHEEEGDPRCNGCNCPHSQALICNLKARAFWWMMARLAGWEGPAATQPDPDLTPSYKAVSSPYADLGERVTYTVGIHNATGPIAQGVLFSDTVPEGLSFIGGTLSATAGSVDESGAPALRWSGVLSPSPIITITYAARVTPGSTTLILPQTHTNTATIAAPGYQTIYRSAAIRVGWRRLFLPLIMKTGFSHRR